MDWLFLCKEGTANSLLSALLLAREARKRGEEAAIVLTEEALLPAVGEMLDWSDGLLGMEHRYAMADNAGALDIPIMGRGQLRQIDIRAFFDRSIEGGINIYASPVWVTLLGLKDSLPAAIKIPDIEDYTKLLGSAKRIIGAF